MKGDQIIDTIIRYVERKGILTDESFLRRAQLFNLFNQVKADVLSQFMAQNIEITGGNYWEAIVDRAEYEQNSTRFSYFEVPKVVMNSYEYVGGTDRCSRFRENLTLSDFQNTVSQQVPKQTEYLKVNNHLMIDNSALSAILVNAIPVNPMDWENFNFEYDEYPIDEALINVVCDRMFQSYQSKSTQAPIDTVSDSKDTTKSIS